MEQSNDVSNGRTAKARCKQPNNKSIIASAKLRATAWKALHYCTMKQSTKPNSAMMSASAIPPKLGEISSQQIHHCICEALSHCMRCTALLHTEAKHQAASMQRCQPRPDRQSSVKEFTAKPLLHVRGSQPLREMHCTLKQSPKPQQSNDVSLGQTATAR